MADLRITELPALTTVLGEDLLAIVDDPTGTAITKKIRTDDFQSTWHVGARVYNNAAITVATGGAVLTFNSEIYDTDSIHSTGTNTGRLTCQKAGKYLIQGYIRWAGHASGVRGLSVLHSSGYLSEITVPTCGATVETAIVIGALWDLEVNEYVELQSFQNSGGNLNATYYASPHFMSPGFAMHKIG